MAGVWGGSVRRSDAVIWLLVAAVGGFWIGVFASGLALNRALKDPDYPPARRADGPRKRKLRKGL